MDRDTAAYWLQADPRFTLGEPLTEAQLYRLQFQSGDSDRSFWPDGTNACQIIIRDNPDHPCILLREAGSEKLLAGYDILRRVPTLRDVLCSLRQGFELRWEWADSCGWMQLTALRFAWRSARWLITTANCREGDEWQEWEQDHPVSRETALEAIRQYCAHQDATLKAAQAERDWLEAQVAEAATA